MKLDGRPEYALRGEEERKAAERVLERVQAESLPEGTEGAVRCPTCHALYIPGQRFGSGPKYCSGRCRIRKDPSFSQPQGRPPRYPHYTSSNTKKLLSELQKLGFSINVTKSEKLDRMLVRKGMTEWRVIHGGGRYKESWAEVCVWLTPTGVLKHASTCAKKRIPALDETGQDIGYCKRLPCNRESGKCRKCLKYALFAAVVDIASKQ